MARQVATVTTEWAQIATGSAVFSVLSVGSGALYFNETATDETAYIAVGKPGEQFEQTATANTFVRATGTGWKVLVDGVL